MHQPLIVIIAGSKSDEAHFQKIANTVKNFEVEVITRIASAHKTAEHALNILKEYEANPRPKIYITVAGRSNALSGFVDGAVSAPVVACPPISETFGGMDIFSSLRMPSGVTPAVVLEPQNAAFFAVRMLALSNPELQKKVQAYQEQQRQQILNDDASVR